MTQSSARLKGAALLSILLIIGVVAAAYLAYRGTVTEAIMPSVSVSVQSDRAGLVMQRGALVKMNGVEIGTVSQVRRSTRGAVIDLRLRGDIAASVPSDVGATIAATTIFGSKMVTLTAPPSPSARPIADGAVIAASSVTVEVNSVFESLTSVLVASQPEKLNTTLGALSTALNGRGRALGTTIENLDTVLGAVTPLVPTLRRDLRSAAVTSGALGDSAPDLVSILASLTTTARTVTDSTDALGPALTSLTGAATDARTVLAENADGVTATVADLVPTTGLLREYSPEFTCFLQGADIARQAAEKVSGGNGRTMLLNSTVLFGVPAYEYAADLPKVAATGGPRCGALPLLSDNDIPAPYVLADTGSNPFRAATTAPVLDPTSIIDFLPGGLAAPRTTR
ncbi:Mce family protein [Rhodococcus sp. Leaf7]|uniref:MCE family protein n=1 Tax=unclassified Rhodococcus (in: high G+C Gram-positive bacteria) TaxID=192944 RepID=UPI0007008532|nr:MULTISPECIES: MCE family protein [unclassified Rhodococcus (in: high G+C Gram-positive bacteria)]KQU07002.1 Mce family protein [Rhodococcus sp. Leaf7]KQU42520.1 Mce family protein [Rhodococcus sp. Leaf247]